VALEALKENAYALEHASAELRGDPELVLSAIRLGIGAVFSFASEELRGNREFALKVVRQCGLAFAGVSDLLRNDGEVAFEAVRQNRAALRYVPEELRADRVMQEVAANPIAVQGSWAPICVLSQLETREAMVFYRGTAGLGGQELDGEISSDASLGDLARELADKVQSQLIYLLLPGLDVPVSPLLFFSPLRDFARRGPT
jgi:hypothetical protein